MAVEPVVGRLQLDPGDRLDPVGAGRRRQVVEEGAAAGEALDPEQLLGVQAAVGGPVLGVALAGDAAAGDVVHGKTGLLGRGGQSSRDLRRAKVKLWRTLSNFGRRSLDGEGSVVQPGHLVREPTVDRHEPQCGVQRTEVVVLDGGLPVEGERPSGLLAAGAAVHRVVAPGGGSPTHAENVARSGRDGAQRPGRDVDARGHLVTVADRSVRARSEGSIGLVEQAALALERPGRWVAQPVAVHVRDVDLVVAGVGRASTVKLGQRRRRLGRARASACGGTLGDGLGVSSTVGVGSGDGVGAPAGPRFAWPGLSMYNAPPMTSTPITAAATTRAESVISVNLRGIRRSRSCGVVSMRRSAPSTARSGARVGPVSTHDRAARSSDRSSVMPAVLPGRWAPSRR